jgi:hypothetical protein
MSAGPYTSDEMNGDLQDWSCATVEQRSEAFQTLLAAVTADAYHEQDQDLIARLRRIRAQRDGVKS